MSDDLIEEEPLFIDHRSNPARIAAAFLALALPAVVALSSGVGCGNGRDSNLCDACEGITGEPPLQPHVACTADTDCMMIPAQTYETACSCTDEFGPSDDSYGCVTYGAAKCMTGFCVWQETRDEQHACPSV